MTEREKILTRIKERNMEQNRLAERNAILRNLNKKDFFENKLWHSLDELKNYEPDNYYSVEVVYEEDDGEFYTKYWSGDILEITEDHHLYYSDYSEGIFTWSEEDQTYCHHYWHTAEKINIVGFFNLKKTYSDEDEITI